MNRPDPSRAVDDASLDAALDVFRRDCRSARPAPRLAERVLAAAARGDQEAAQFHRVARAYAAAAAVLAAVGVAGTFAVHRDGGPAALRERSTLVDLEDARLSGEGTLSVADLTVGGRLR